MMRVTRNIIPSLTFDHDAEKKPPRGSGRMFVEGVKCNRGKVIDLSKKGAKLIVKRPWKIEERRKLVLTGSRVRVTVMAECRHVAKVGFRRHVVGLQFEEVDAGISAALMEIVRSHCRFIEEPELY
jgi:hypothetical protein